MNFENFIGKALEHPTDTIAYSVSRKLATLFPDRAVLEGEERAFDPFAFARAGRCEVVGAAHVHNQTRVEWRGAKRPLLSRPENAWLNVLWQGHLLDAVVLTWHDEGCRTRFFWIAAESREVAEGFLRAVCEWCSEAHGEVLVFERGYWWKDELLLEAVRGATFETLVLPPGLDAELRADVERFFASRETYERYGAAWKRGLLFTGPPGNGKTHAVKAIVNAAGKPCLYVRSFESRNDTVDGNMRDVFERARRAAPCILVFEDLDALVDKKNRSFFLNELDGFASNAGVLALATTNHPKRIDAALVDRPGRFDRRFVFELPAEAERRAFAERWNAALAPELRASAGGLEAVARETEGFSFAYLKELFVSSTAEWVGAAERRPMDEVLSRRAAALREQRAKAGKSGRG